MWPLIIEILKALLSGEFKRLWAEHEEREANDARNNVEALSESDLDKRVQSDITRR